MCSKKTAVFRARSEQSKASKEKALKQWQWEQLSCNQKEVAKRLVKGDYRLISWGGWGLLDKFIIFLKAIKFLTILDIDGQGYVRQLITAAKLLLTYNVKILMGIKSINQVPQLLFNDVGLLMMLGFTAEQIKKGHCLRGKNKKNKPMHKDTLGDALDRFSPEEMEKILNSGVELLAANGFVEDSGYIMDDTDLETTEKCAGCGCKTVKEKKRKKGKEFEIEVTKYGFKLLVIRGVKSRQVVAAKVLKINEDSRPYVIELIKQARKNIGADKIKLLLMDRGFIDGEILWEIKKVLGIDFIIPARTDMAITADARGLRNVLDKEGMDRQERKNISVIGIESLTSYDQYGDEEHNQENKTSKDFAGQPLNAVMVTKWDGHEYPAGEEKVFLTTLPVNQPLKIIDLYDLRSLIENTTFRELKQGWLINTVCKKTRNGVTSHALLTLCMFNMSNAFRTKLGQDLAEQGVRSWRIDTLAQTRNKVIVVSGQYYGIFDLEEIMILVSKPPSEFWRTNPQKFKHDYGLTKLLP